MKLHNTLSRTKVEFQPLTPGHVKLYTCGPTVYHYAHIGNLRNLVFNDTLRRTLELSDFKVHHVMNITDVGHLASDGDEGEDKLEVGARTEGKTVWEVAEFYTHAFKNHSRLLGILPPTQLINATTSIDAQLELIQALIDKGFAYQTSQAIYFEVTKLENYGKLTGQNLQDKEVGVRKNIVTDANKHHPQDFALWFFTVGHFANHQMHWASSWGEGFPGWHLECSAIIHEALGETIDIHTGGVDHIGTHHTNEIAQSEAAYDKPLANYWLHNEFLLLDGGKMAKSGGNSITLEDVIEHGFDPLALRLLYLQSHYRSQQNFDWDIMQSAQNALDNLRAWADLQFQGFVSEGAAKRHAVLFSGFETAMCDDLNTPLAYAAIASMVTDSEAHNPDSREIAKYTLAVDRYLGLGLSTRVNITTEDKIVIAERESARKNGDYAAADSARSHLLERGIHVDDTKNGSRWSRVIPK